LKHHREEQKEAARGAATKSDAVSAYRRQLARKVQIPKLEDRARAPARPCAREFLISGRHTDGTKSLHKDHASFSGRSPTDRARARRRARFPNFGIWVKAKLFSGGCYDCSIRQWHLALPDYAEAFGNRISTVCSRRSSTKGIVPSVSSLPSTDNWPESGKLSRDLETMT
jgi:hypothetical protein